MTAADRAVAAAKADALRADHIRDMFLEAAARSRSGVRMTTTEGGDPMTDPTRDALRERIEQLRQYVDSDHRHWVELSGVFAALATPDPAPDSEAKRLLDSSIPPWIRATPDPAPDVEAAWFALTRDFTYTGPWDREGADFIVARHRPIIEAAIRAQGGGLDVETLATALHDEWDSRIGEPSEPGIVCGDCTESAVRVIRTYARLRDTPQPAATEIE